MQPRVSDKAKFSNRKENSRAYSDRLTQDQKRFRILQLLKNGSPIKISSMLFMRIGSKPDDLIEILNDMLDKKWIEDPASIPSDQWKKDHEFKILDEGKKIVEMLSIVKAISPNHPFFDFDMFNMSETEKIDVLRKSVFNNHFAIEPSTDESRLKDIRKLNKTSQENLVTKS